jgi:thiol-disulfide isomerase/thioredoxin
MRAALLTVLLTALVACGARPEAPITTGVPKPMPELSFQDLAGNEAGLDLFRGQVVVLNLWATWCAPCREEMPSFERLRASLDGRGVVLAVNLAEPESRVRRFLDTVPVRYAVLLDRDGATARAWQARVLPATYIIGPDGAIRYRHLGELDWSSPEVRELILKLLK